QREAESAVVDEEAIAREIPEYPRISVLRSSREKLKDFEMRRRMDLKNYPGLKHVYQRFLDKAVSDRRAAETDLDTLEDQLPVQVQAVKLVEDMKALREEGHIVLTDSVREDLD